MALESKLIKLSILKGAEFRRHATEGPDKPELHSDDVTDETEPSLPRKLEAILGFTLHLHERISRCQKVCVQVDAAVHCKTEVADLVRGLERPMYQGAASPDMFRRWDQVTSEDHIGPGPEALQAAFFDQFIAEPAESKSGLVVAEVRSSYLTKPYIGNTRTFAVAPLEAEIDRPADGQGKKVRLRKQCRRQDLGQNIQSREGCGVAHQGQLDELLDLAASELRPDSLVFSFHFLFCRVGRPFDAQMPYVVEPHTNR